MCCFNNGCCRRNRRCESWCNRNNNRWPCEREIRESYENSFNEGRNRCGGRESESNDNFNDNFSDNFSDNFRENFNDNFRENFNDNFNENFNDNLNHNLNDNFSNNLNDNFSNNFSDNFSNNNIFFINFNVDDNIEV